MKLNKPNTPGNISSGPKIFDVSKPGGSTPSTSGRPLIVTHRPMVQDPMVNAPLLTDPDVVVPEKPRLIEKQEPVLKPQKIELSPSAKTEVDQEAAEPTANEPAEPVASKPANEPEGLVESAEESAKPANDSTKITVTAKTPDTAAVAATIPEQAPITQETNEADAEEETSSDNEPLVDSKKYYVHISSPTKKRSMQLAVTGAILIILVAIGCADAMLDAGVMTISGVPHTHFIQK